MVGDSEGARSPCRPKEELLVVALEESSVQPKPWEPFRRQSLRVEVETGMGSRAAVRRLRTEYLGL